MSRTRRIKEYLPHILGLIAILMFVLAEIRAYGSDAPYMTIETAVVKIGEALVPCFIGLTAAICGTLIYLKKER
ncbi:MAG: hypothetical protein ACFFDI_24515 [Promethearchaeota archaeon]